MNFTNFDRDFQDLVRKAVPEDAKKGLVAGAWEMLRDCDKEQPTTPRDIGDLQGSKMVEKPVVTANEISVKAGFNSIYAAYQHEKEVTERSAYTTPGSGPKFLQTKMIRNKNKYIQVAANHIKKTLK